jgi:hypothetical protein
MPSFVPNSECDVFVSFASADNRPVAASQEGPGWVASLIERLNILLGQKLGRKDWGELWCSSTQPDAELSPEVVRRLAQGAMLLVVISDAYLASPTCQRELDVFLRSLKEADEVVDRVVVVMRDDIDRQLWPEGLRHLLAHELFVHAGNGNVQEPRVRRLAIDDRMYSTRVDDLSSELAIRLQRRRTLAETGSLAKESRVFLGVVTENLEILRDGVKRYLVQDGFRVLPECRYPRDGAEFRKATLADLERSILFVQLLSPGALKQNEDLPQGYDGLQYECAKALDKPVLRWRSPDIDLSSIIDPVLRHAMTRENVVAVGLEEFKRKVVERANSLSTSERRSANGAYVVVNASDVDLQLASQVRDTLSRKGLACDVECREDIHLEDISASHPSFGGLLIVYGACPAIWVRQQLWRYRKAMARSESLPPVCAVYEGPPPAKDELRFSLPTMKLIDGRSSFDESALDPFIKAVLGRCST